MATIIRVGNVVLNYDNITTIHQTRNTLKLSFVHGGGSEVVYDSEEDAQTAFEQICGFLESTATHNK